jgi:hypothetical protein
VNIELITAAITVAVLTAVVGLRSATSGKVAITLNDAIIAAIAAALVLLISGKLTKIGVGETGVTIETAKEAILNSAAVSIEQQVEKLPVEPVEQALKGGTGEIPNMIQKRVQGLDLRLGAGYYNASDIAEYLNTLTKHHFFRYVIFLNSDDKLFGMVEARSLLSVLNTPNSGLSLNDFVDAVNRGNGQTLAQLPGFVSASNAVTGKSDKRDVLTRMENSRLDWLPVVDEQRHLVGIVDRSRLTASMILDVTNRLQPKQSTSESGSPQK